MSSLPRPTGFDTPGSWTDANVYGLTVGRLRPGIAGEEVVAFALRVIDAHVELIPILRACRRGDRGCWPMPRKSAADTR